MRSLTFISLLLIATAASAQMHHRLDSGQVWSLGGEGTVIEVSNTMAMRSLSWDQTMLILGPDPENAGAWRVAVFVEEREGMRMSSDPRMPTVAFVSGSMTTEGDWTEAERLGTDDLFEVWSPAIAFGHMLPEMEQSDVDFTIDSALNLGSERQPVTFHGHIVEVEALESEWSYWLREPVQVEGLTVASWTVDVLWDLQERMPIRTTLECVMNEPERRLHTEARMRFTMGSFDNRPSGAAADAETLRGILESLIDGEDVSGDLAAFLEAHHESALAWVAVAMQGLAESGVTTPE